MWLVARSGFVLQLVCTGETRQINALFSFFFFFESFAHKGEKNVFNIICEQPVDVKIFFFPDLKWLSVQCISAYYPLTSYFICIYSQSFHIIILYSFNYSKMPYNVDERPLISVLRLRIIFRINGRKMFSLLQQIKCLNWKYW